MANIFSTNNNETLVIYPQNNRIYLLVTSENNPCTPVLLAEDYKSNLSAFIYNQVLYYTYVNAHGEIVTKSTLDNQTVYALATPEDAAPYKEALAKAEGEVAALKDETVSLKETNASLKKTIISLEKTIASAKEQYATLMDTATKYREEAQKWYRIVSTRKQ